MKYKKKIIINKTKQKQTKTKTNPFNCNISKSFELWGLFVIPGQPGVTTVVVKEYGK